jgi:hypothetical protein
MESGRCAERLAPAYPSGGRCIALQRDLRRGGRTATTTPRGSKRAPSTRRPFTPQRLSTPTHVTVRPSSRRAVRLAPGPLPVRRVVQGDCQRGLRGRVPQLITSAISRRGPHIRRGNPTGATEESKLPHRYQTRVKSRSYLLLHRIEKFS